MSDYYDRTDANILIVDDEAINLAILIELLEFDGYKSVDIEESPRRAVELYQKKDYDLVLLDINMPDLNGFEVMKLFDKIDLALPPPVIILTALTDRDTKLRALKSGARDFLTKPFDHEEVLCRVTNLVDLHLSQKELISLNTELEHRVFQRTKDLDAAKVDIVNRLAIAADYRDTETSEHTLRVGAISSLLAKAKGYNEDYCHVLRKAAPMHDIGKIGIPDTILLKPGKLTDQEMEIMKTHTIIGEKMLSGSPSEILKMAQVIAITHHERWDGQGYPKGLAGLDIPIEGRIVILADIFDALTSERPYKQAWALDETIEFIKQQNGQIFDPEMVDLFLQNLTEINRVKEDYCD